MKKFLLTFLLFLIFCVKINAQFLEVEKPLTINDGLSQNYIHYIYQDSKGFIWFGTKDGLNRFDGYEFKIFKNDIHDKSSLSSNYVRAICEDENNNLWIGTGKGLSKYNLVTGRFEQNKLPEILKQTLKNKQCTSLAIDKRNTLWIGTSKGIYSLSLTNHEFADYSTSAFSLADLSNNYIHRIFENSDGMIWFGTVYNGVFYFDTLDKKLIRVKTPLNFSGYITAIMEISKGKMLISAFRGGISLFSTLENKINWLDPRKYNYDPLIKSVTPYKKDECIIASRNAVYIFNISDYTFRKIWDKSSMGRPYFITIDNSGVLWMGTSGNGIFLFKPEHKNFNTVKRASTLNPGLSFESVRSFFMDSYKRLWVGGHGGLNKMDLSSDTYVWESIETFKNFSVYTIIQDPLKKNSYWIGTESHGLYKYDYLSGEKKRLLDGTEPFLPLKKVIGVYKILVSSTNNIYLGAGKSLVRYNPQSKKYTEYLHDPDNTTSIVNGNYKAIYEDSRGRIWIGSGIDGISVFDTTTGEFQNFRTNESEFCLSANRVNSFCADQEGTMWIGTENGLNKFLPKKNGFENYSIKDGLLNDYIYGILCDSVGNLWLSTNRGISKFNPVTKEFKNFDASYGLQSNEFNTAAFYKSSEGELFFGGINGFNSFFPEDIKLSDYQPEVLFTRFKKSNKEFDLPKSITYLDTLELSYKDRFFSFDFTSTDFVNPEKVQFRYLLEGFGDEWIYTDQSNKSAGFTNIDPGEYKLRVAATNRDGILSPKEKSLTIIIHPAFWQTTWFKSSSLMIILMIVFLLIRSKINRLMAEREMQREFSGKLINSQEVEREKISNALHDDLGQDLLVVSNKLMHAKQNDSYKDQVNESIKILSKSIENISNISHLLHPSELKLLGLTLALESMIELVRNSSEIKINRKLISMDEYFSEAQWINVFRIVQESLNNIIKHSNATEASVYSTVTKKRLTIAITDNGKGFAPEKTGLSFKDRPHLGLTGMKERVNMLNGRMKIDSTPGKGTKIVFKFPVY